MGAVVKRAGAFHLDLVERGKRTVNSASLSQGMLTDDTVKYAVSSNSVLDIKINDTIEAFGNIYRINSLPAVKKISNSSYTYDIDAQGLMYDLLRCKFFNADGADFKTTTNFPLIGNLEVFLIAIKNNMARFSNLWEVGTVASTETKMITFGDDTCLSALQKICQEFKTDFWVKSEAGKYKIHTGQFGSTIAVDFEYGKGKGLYNLSRKNVDDNGIINRLFVNGGSNNIPAGYRNFSDNLKFSDLGYLEDTALIAEIGLREGSIEFPEIYPKRTGTISSLGDTKFKFRDASMDFDLNEKEADGITTKYLIAGTSAKVHFNTGNLAGYEFEIKKGGYNHTTKEFEIIPFKNTTGQKFPDEIAAAFQFSVGDEYVILDIVMPQTYITNAETELLTKATEQFALKKTAKVSYDLEVDPEYFKTLATPISIGDYVKVIDSALGINKVIRVQAITRNFITGNKPTPYNYKITLADTYEINYASQMVLDITEIKNVISITNLGEINLSQLGYKTTQELRNLIFDTDGFFDPVNIKPFSVTTNMLTVGAQSQQLSCSVVFMVNNDGPNQIASKAGVIYSQTFNKSWVIAADIVDFYDNNFRYVYGKCSKTGTSGTIHFSQSQIKFDENPNDYYFLIGVLHTVTEGVRILSITIGTTTINGGLIRTGIISSLDGQTYFNLNTGEIKGKITFTSDSPAFQQLNDLIVIGGRNYLPKSKNKPLSQSAGSSTQLSNGFRVNNAISANAFEPFLSTLEDGKEYTISIKIKKISGGVGSVSVYLNANNDYVVIPGTNALTTSFKVYSLTRTFTGTNAVQPYFIFPNGNLEIEYIKIEKGTKATDWTPAPEDISEQVGNANTNSANALLQAQNAQNTANSAAAVTNFLQTTVEGNVVSTGTLQVGDVVGANAMITGVTDQPNGESIRFAAGKPYAEKYNSPFQVLDNGMVRFVNPINGFKTFELGYNAITGKVVFDIYNASQVKIASIGENGISFTGYIPESYTETKFRKLTTAVFTASAVQTEIQNQIEKVFIRGATVPNYTVWSEWLISVIENYTAYLYNEGRNFESADNAQYAGYFTTANKFGTRIPNGIYVVDSIQGQIVGDFPGHTYPRTFIYYTEAYKILDGNVIDMISIQVTKTISGTDWSGTGI